MAVKFSPALCDQLKFLNPLITNKFKEASPEELCSMYQSFSKSGDGRGVDACIAAMFNKMFGQINSIFMIDKYCAPNLSDEDKASEILDCIAEIMSLFDPNKNIKFITFFTTCLHRKLYAVVKPYKYKCRYITNELIVSYEANLDNDDSDNNTFSMSNMLQDDNSSNFVNYLEAESFVHSMPFSDIQIKIANVIIAGGTSNNKDVAKTLNMQTSEVSRELKKMRRICLQNGVQGVF